jgi:voltage-gated potassium channel
MQEKINKTKLIIEDILALITVFSLFMIALETVPNLESYKSVFYKIEVFVVIIFSIEYIVRIITAKNKFAYIFSFYGIADLLSVLPTLLGLGNFVFLKTLRLIRISRLFRMINIYNLSRMAESAEKRTSVEENINFFFYLKSIIALTFFLGGLMYIFEFGTPGFESLPENFKWAFQMLVGWTPITSPETITGEALKMTTKISGFLMLAMLVYVIREGIIEKK